MVNLSGFASYLLVFQGQKKKKKRNLIICRLHGKQRLRLKRQRTRRLVRNSTWPLVSLCLSLSLCCGHSVCHLTATMLAFNKRRQERGINNVLAERGRSPSAASEAECRRGRGFVASPARMQKTKSIHRQANCPFDGWKFCQ